MCAISLSLLSAIASADVHPAFLAGFPIGWGHLVVDRRHTGCFQGVDIAQGALIVALGLWDFFLSKGACRCDQKSEHQ